MSYKKIKFSLAAAAIASITACQPSTHSIADFANTVAVNYQHHTNFPAAKCESLTLENCFKSSITLTPSEDFSGNDWSLYISHIRPLKQLNSDYFELQKIQGDLYKISPTEQFTGFKANQSYRLDFIGQHWMLSESDIMPNWYMTDGNNQAYVIAASKPEIDPLSQLEVLPFVTQFTHKPQQVARSKSDKMAIESASALFEQSKDLMANQASILNTIPSVSSIVQSAPELIDMSKGVSLQGALVEQLQPAWQRLIALGLTENPEGVNVITQLDSSLAYEAYQLQTNVEKISITAADEVGLTHGLSTLASLLDAQNLKLAQVNIEDAPAFGFRGMHIDVARNFYGKDFVLQLIEQMAAVKLNKLHLHMADDEGWRLQINALPELTEVGAYRCHDLTEQTCVLPQLGSGSERGSQVNGYFSETDYVEILRFAAARNIEIIPSMDMPGHSRAAIKAMQAREAKLMAQGLESEALEYRLHDPLDKTEYLSIQYYSDNTLNVCLDSTYHFVDTVIDGIIAMHNKAGVPLITYHIGADETAGAWVESPACKQMLEDEPSLNNDPKRFGPFFIEKVANMLDQKGIVAAGWSDGMSHVNPELMPAKVQSNIWDKIDGRAPSIINTQLHQDWQVVLSMPEVMYFDMPYAVSPQEPGYYWATRSVPMKKIFNFVPEPVITNAQQWLDIEGQPLALPQLALPTTNNRIAGIQGQLWSETVRSPERAAYMVYPRLQMLAERAWHKPAWLEGNRIKQAEQQQAWANMANGMGHKQLYKLDVQGVLYRIPSPGATVNAGMLEISSPLPGLSAQYSLDGQWLDYVAPVKVSQADTILVRLLSADGKRVGRALGVQ